MCASSSVEHHKDLRLRLRFSGPAIETDTVSEKVKFCVLLKGSYKLSNRCGKCLELRVQLEPVSSYLFWREVRRSAAFRVNFSVWLFDQWRKKTKNPCCTCVISDAHFNNMCSISIKEKRLRNSCDALYRIHVYAELLPIISLCLTRDVRWSAMLLGILTEYAQLQYVMAWLSTLGGAYSALGDHSTQCSQKAGKISGQQLLVASRLGNATLAAQCKVFFAMSLIQRGYLNEAVAIIREQYNFAVSRESNRDEKLISSCKSAWNRIRYMKQQQKDKRRNR